MPCRSPVGEWHELHFAGEVRLVLRPRSPMTMFGGGAAMPGGPPWRPDVASTLWMYSATARTSSSESGSGGMPRSARLPRTIGSISSPC